MTENERVRYLRKEKLHITMDEFGSRLGVTKGSISSIESGARGLTNQMATAICREYGVREEWLRNGEEPMFVSPEDFSLDAFARQHGASDLDLRVLRAFFSVDADTRKMFLDQFQKFMEEEQAKKEDAPLNPANMTKEQIHAHAQKFAEDLERQMLEEKKAAGGSSASDTTDSLTKTS